MEVVINDCYGGFGLSPFGKVEYLKRKGKVCCFYRLITKGRYEKYTPNIKEKEYYITTTLDLGNVVPDFPKDYYFDDDGIERNDTDLIHIIEEFGSEKVSGYFANLKIIEIPDDVDWDIEEYDGAEWIAEKHRVWK
jgi:hypothetical protein